MFSRKKLLGLLKNSHFAGWIHPRRMLETITCQCGKKQAMKDKVAIVTGGAGGIGIECCRRLLATGAVGVTIADANQCTGQRAAETLCEEFGDERAIFVKCDVTQAKSLDWAYKDTLDHFGCIDVVVNNAGIMNDQKWEQSIATNVGGYVVGSLLGIQYMTKACTGKEGLIVNICSTAGINPFCGVPIYSMTQAAIVNFTRAMGNSAQYQRTGVRVVALCAGPTCTPLLENGSQYALNKHFRKEFEEELGELEVQGATFVVNGLISVLMYAESGTVWVCEDSMPAYQIGFPINLKDLKCKEE